jgi:hypothetical protein
LVASACEVLPVQLVGATPLLSLHLTIHFERPIPGGCSSLLPKQKAFSLHLCSRMTLNHLNSWTWDFVEVLRRPIETTPLLGMWKMARFPVSMTPMFSWQPGPFFVFHPRFITTEKLISPVRVYLCAARAGVCII